LVGLSVQLAFFGLFLVVTALFHWRINRQPTTRSLDVSVPWRRFILVLYTVCVIILVRCIYRVVEYEEGRGGELQSKEVYYYVFDATLMFIVPVIFSVFPPGQIIGQVRKGEGVELA
jgi:hypothetical protein